MAPHTLIRDNQSIKLRCEHDQNSGKKAGTSPTHVYKSAGDFTITLSVKDSIDRVSQYSQSVSVSEQEGRSSGGGFSIVVLLMLMTSFSRKMKK